MADPELVIPSDSFLARRSAFFEALSDQNLKSKAPAVLDTSWFDEITERFDTAVERGQRWGNRLTMIIQFADGQIPYDSPFIDAYFEKFGAHISTSNGKRLDVRTRSLSEAASSVPQLEFDYLNEHLNEIPDGSFTVRDSKGWRGHFVVETDIEGIRLLLEGPAIGRNFQGAIRPMFLVKIDDAPRSNLRLPEDEEAERKQAQRTFRELHGRDTTPGASMTEHERQQFGSGLIQGSQEEQNVAHAALAWAMETKSADEIKVTPTKLKEDPSLKTEQERLEAVREALSMAVDNLRLQGQGLGRPVIGAMTYGLAILTQVLKETPEEIIKDGEGLAGLVEYLEEAACSRVNPNALGHTDIIGPPPAGDPFTEIAKRIKDTWDFPKNTAFHDFPFMYQRINWKSRAQQARNN